MPEAEIRHMTPLAGRDGGEPPLTVLSEGDVLRGRLEMKGDGHLMGSFEGEIECAGELLVGPEATVSAQVRAVHVTISGQVTGNLVARGRLKITATGRLHGDAQVAALVVQEGGVHFGTLRVHPEGVPDELEPVPEPAMRALGSAPGPRPVEAGAVAGSRPLAASVDRVKKMWGEFF